MSSLTFETLKQRNINPYEVLEVASNASDAEIRKSYRKLALKYHPDKNPEESAKAKFQLIKQGYEFLISNRAERQKYDEFLEQLQQLKDRENKLSAEKLAKRRKLLDSENGIRKDKDTKLQRQMLITKLREEGMRRRTEAANAKQSLGEKQIGFAKGSVSEQLRTVVIQWVHPQKDPDLRDTVKVFGDYTEISTADKATTIVFESLLSVNKLLNTRPKTLGKVFAHEIECVKLGIAQDSTATKLDYYRMAQELLGDSRSFDDYKDLILLKLNTKGAT